MPKNTTPQPEPDESVGQAALPAADQIGADQPGPDQPGAEQPAAGGAYEPPTAPPLAEPLAGNRFFAWMRSLNLNREPGWIGGVAAGIATRLGVDPLIVRGIIVVVAVLGGPALLLYAAAWLLLPDENDKIHLEEVFKGRLDSPIAGIGALILLSMLPVTQGFWFAGSAFWGEPFWAQSFGRALWTVVLLGLIVWFVIWVARRSSRASNVPTQTPATTDARPDTIPQPHTAAHDAAAAASVAAGAPGARPVAPPGTATAEEFAAWRLQQEQWKAENVAFRTRQANEQRAASLAAQAQYRAERAARRAVYEAHHARTRSNPLYSFIAIGLALVVGGVVTVLQGDGAIEPAGVLAGLGATLAVLALAIIVNGVRGHRPGGAQGLAGIVLVPLLIAAVLPHSPNISYVDNATFAPRAEESYSSDVYLVGAADTVIDLRDYFDEPLPAGYEGDLFSDTTVVSGAGDVTVLVPSDAALSYSATIGSGRLDSPDGDARGAWVREYGQFNLVDGVPPGEEPERAMYLTVTMGTGTLTFEQTAATEGASE
jgi:phage shock protein PspC (stress-responsive transcriptional regulator)